MKKRAPVNQWAADKRKELIASMGGRCRRCGNTSKLEFAHISQTKLTGRGRGLAARICDIRKNHHCYTLLCRVCHMLFDAGK